MSQNNNGNEEAKLHLWVGGMTCGAEGAVQMLLHEDPDHLPDRPFIMFAMDLPLVWFWWALQQPGESKPELPKAFDSRFFDTRFEWTWTEFVELQQSIFKSVEE